MFYHIEGSVSEMEPMLAVIDCGGIGVALNVTANTLAGLTVLGYSSAEIAPVLKKIDTQDMTAEQIIKTVLKQMVK